MKSEKVVVWNATNGGIRVGEKQTIIKPAQKMTVDLDQKIADLVAAGKLVVVKSVQVEVNETVDATEQVQAKKKKKEVAKEESTVEETKEEEIAEKSTTESIETPEDSILADEPF